MISLDSSDDDVHDVVEVTKTELKSNKPAASSSNSPKKAVPEKAVPISEKPARSKATPKKEAPQKGGSSSTAAKDILASIPDAELPDPDNAKPFNFFAKATQDNSSDMTVDIPEAQPNCLAGLTIVFTGVLPQFGRDAAESLAKQYGAKVTKSISGKTSVVVVGEDAGPAKARKIMDLKIKAIDEAGFLTLIRSMPKEGGDSKEALAAKQKREAEQRHIEDMARQDELDAQRAESEATRKRVMLEQTVALLQTSSDRPAPIAEIPILNDEKLWTVKHAPLTIAQLCGNKGAIAKLERWLAAWFDNSKAGFKRPGPDGTGAFRAILISGPPGIGKTSAAHLVANKLGFDVLEKNALDVRSKSLLNLTVKLVLNNTSVVGFFKDKENRNTNKRFCLIMDEVDGMSSGDHGGAGALLAFCKITSMPIILICNDKSLPKMRTFDSVTYDLPFRRPTEVEVRARLMSIALREKIKLDPSVIGMLVQATNHDMRQMINMLANVLTTQPTIGSNEARKVADAWQKHTALKPFDVTARLLGGGQQLLLNEKIDLYFNDMDMTPLMIQENYLATQPNGMLSVKDHLRKVARAADDISLLDGISAKIRSSEQQWSLLPFHAVMLAARPSFEVAGRITGRIAFAMWLGQNSKLAKMGRWLAEVQCHARLRTLCDKPELRLDYVPVWISRMVKPLLGASGGENIPRVIDVMDHYYLTREDWQAIIDMGIGPNKDAAAKIDTKTKTAFTRQYNALTHPIAIYKAGGIGSLAPVLRPSAPDYDGMVEDDTAGDDKEEMEIDRDAIDTKRDKLIKAIPASKRKKPAKTPKDNKRAKTK